MFRRVFSLAFLSWAAFGLPQAATAQVGVDVTVGLNPRLAGIVERYPEKIKEQALELIKGAKPMLDASVISYMDRINEIISQQLSDLPCTITAVDQMFGDDVKSIVFGSEIAPIREVEDDYARIKDSFSNDSKPIDYRVKYADLLVRLHRSFCHVREAGEAATMEVTAIETPVNAKWRAWYRLPGDCGNADSCLISLRQETQQKIAQAKKEIGEKLVNEKVDADNRMAPILRYKTPTYWERLGKKWEPTLYENTFMVLFSIQDELALAISQGSANKKLAEATAILAAATKSISSASERIAANPAAALKGCSSALDQKEKFKADIESAKELWPTPVTHGRSASLTAAYEGLLPEKQRCLLAAGMGQVAEVCEVSLKNEVGVRKTSDALGCLRSGCDGLIAQKLAGSEVPGFETSCVKAGVVGRFVAR